MIPMAHLKDEVEPDQVPLTLLNLSEVMIKIATHTKMATLWLYADYQELQNFEI